MRPERKFREPEQEDQIKPKVPQNWDDWWPKDDTSKPKEYDDEY